MYDERDSDSANSLTTTDDASTSASTKTPDVKKPRPRRRKPAANPGKSLLVIRQGAKELLTITFLQDDASGLSFEFKNCEGESHGR